MRKIALLFLGLGLILPLPAMAELRLIMIEEHGCMWCQRWNAEIAPIYPKTPEGAAAPLQRLDKFDAVPKDLTFARQVAYTPTFILVQNGHEVHRIEGYPGEDFFWGLLGKMIEDTIKQPLTN